MDNEGKVITYVAGVSGSLVKKEHLLIDSNNTKREGNKVANSREKGLNIGPVKYTVEFSQYICDRGLRLKIAPYQCHL